MALGPEVINPSVRRSFIEKVEAYIDARLRAPDFIIDWRQGGADNPYWTFVLGGTATKGEKDELISRYTKVGWGSVEVSNSEETEPDRPGLVSVRLYRNPQPPGPR